MIKKISKKKIAKKTKMSAGASVFHFHHHVVALGRDRNVRIGVVMFNDPGSRNSFRVETARQLAKMLPQIEKTCEALVFQARGRVFCSGGNLKDHVAQGAVRGKAANREISNCLSRLAILKIPTVAIVTGDALGGGLELLSAFDTVLAVPHALFGFWQRRLGLAFGWGGGARLARRVGSRARLTRLALESRALTAGEAHDLGLIDRVCAAWSIEREAIAEALRLASLPSVSIAAMKELKRVSPVEAKREQHAFEKLWFGPVHRAHLETRKLKPKRKSNGG